MDHQKNRDQSSASSSGAGPPEVFVFKRTGEIGSGLPPIRIHKDRIVIGSVISADLRLTGAGVAPIHAVLEWSSNGKANVFDLASETGIFINGSKVVTAELKAGDRLKVGPSEFEIGFEDPEHTGTRRAKRAGDRYLYPDETEDLSSLLLEDGVNRQEIFDYRPAERKSVEVVMSWCGSILDIQHFAKTKTEITLGQTLKEDFAGAPIASPRLVWIEKSGEGATVNLDSKMMAVVQKGGRLETKKGSGTLELGPNDFAKIAVDDVDFYVSFTASPPRLRNHRASDRDPAFFQSMIFSLLGTAAVFGGFMMLKVPDPIEAEQLPDRLAAVIYKTDPVSLNSKRVQEVMKEREKTEPVVPKKPVPKPPVKVEVKPNQVVPKEVPKTISGNQPTKEPPKKPANGASTPKASGGQNQAKEGEGARAKGAEGTRGQKNAPKAATPQDKANRPSPQGGTGAGGSQSQVEGNGNVQLLKGAGERIQNLLGASANKLGSSGQKLKGFGGFTSEGKGGLALSGSGAGGGGTAESLGGLGNKGLGGGKVGTGLGAAGTGQGILGGKARVALQTGGIEETVVMGAIDQAAILAAILEHKDEFRLCYEREVNAEKPDLSGQVLVVWTIGPSGRVAKAGIQRSTMNNANVDRCVVDVMKRINFPRPEGGGSVTATFPFRFRPTGT